MNLKPDIGKEATEMELLDQWFKELIYPGDVKDFFEELEGHGGPEEIKRAVSIYTEENQYIITVISRKDGNSYLGCVVNARKARPGEGWIRGNDLPDGPFTRKTWDRIVYAIVSYEMVKLSPFQKPDVVPK